MCIQKDTKDTGKRNKHNANRFKDTNTAVFQKLKTYLSRNFVVVEEIRLSTYSIVTNGVTVLGIGQTNFWSKHLTISCLRRIVMTN